MDALHILFQDQFLVAIDKPAGMIVHPGRDLEGPELIAMKRLRDEIGQRVFPVHRIDRPTSGVLIFGLEKQTAAALQQAFERRLVEKIYHAIVIGQSPKSWISTSPMSNDPDGDPLPAETAFETLATTTEGKFPAESGLVLSLLRAMPKTGRFHQIRRHLAEAGHPVIGDFRYAGIEQSFRHGEILMTGTRMLLHAKSLEFTHPKTGNTLIIEAPDVPEFRKIFPRISSPNS